MSADYNKGIAAYEMGDYATALRECRPLAEQGLAVAQSNLGIMYFEGKGVLQDDKTALRWYRLAAKQGDIWSDYKVRKLHNWFGKNPTEPKKVVNKELKPQPIPKTAQIRVFSGNLISAQPLHKLYPKSRWLIGIKYF